MNELEKDFRKFDEPPFLMGRVACGINAAIEVLNLPVEKLTDYEPMSIAYKLMELSSKDYQNYIQVEDQGRLLQDIIEMKCKDDNTRRSILKLCQQKYDHLLKEKELI